MSYATFIVGLLAAAFGAYAMNFGWGIVAVERGWASLIAGAALLSGGLVVMALALVMAQVARLRAALVETRAPAGAAQEEAERLDAPSQDAALVFEPAESLAPPQPAAAAFEEAPKVLTREAPREPPKAGGEEASRPPAVSGAPERRAVVWADRPDRRDEAQNAAADAPSRRVEAPAPPDNTPEASIDDVRRVVAQTIRERTAAPPPPEAARAAPPQPGEPLPRAQEPRAQGSRTEAPGAASAGPPADPIAQDMSGAQNAAAQDRTDASAGQDERRKTLDREAPRRRPAASSFHLPRAVGLDGLGPRSGTAEGAGAAPARKPPAPPSDAAAIGRYESEGTSYVMFADGSIEATSPRGVFRFSSMTELKAFMEQQASG